MAPGPTTSTVPCSRSGPSQQTCEKGYHSLFNARAHTLGLCLLRIIPGMYPISWSNPAVTATPSPLLAYRVLPLLCPLEAGFKVSMFPASTSKHLQRNDCNPFQSPAAGLSPCYGCRAQTSQALSSLLTSQPKALPDVSH